MCYKIIEVFVALPQLIILNIYIYVIYIDLIFQVQDVRVCANFPGLRLLPHVPQAHLRS